MTGEKNSAKYKIVNGGSYWKWEVRRKFLLIWWPVYNTDVYGNAVDYIKRATSTKYFDENGEELCN